MKSCYIVTGASRGIGLGVCFSLLKRGYNVIGIARSIGESQKIQQEFPLSFKYVVGDICNEDDQEDLINTAIKSFEHIRGLVLNAA